MSIFNQLFPCSFRGRTVYLSSATTDFGRKQIKHEYPNSDKQKIQDLGLKPRVFKMTAQISQETEIDPRTYFQKKNDFLAALEEPGAGTLSHPFFSASFEVVARPGTVSESMTEAGIATFELTFDISDRQTDPAPSKTSLSQINQALQDTDLAVNTSIADRFLVSTGLNQRSAEALLEGFSETVSSTTDTFNKLEDPNNEFSSLLGDFTDSITDLISQPQELADSIQAVISGSSALYQTTEESLQVFIRFFDFGDDINFSPNTTDERIERNQNNSVIKLATQVSYLSLSYQFAAETTFLTVDEITDLLERLENQHSKIVNEGADSEVLLSLNNLRVLTNQYLEAEKLNAAQIIDINTKTMPMAVLAYQYYGDIDTLQDITNTLTDINRPKSNNTSFISGDVQILTQ